jgi:hypothetical protein
VTIIIAGERVSTAFESVSWVDNPREVPKATDGRARAKDAAKAIVLHTVHGKRGALKTGGKPSKRAESYARYQAATARDVSWHFTVDTDGTVVQSADPALWLCWHAGAVNAWTIGIELVQDADGTLYDATLASVVALCELLCASLAIPRRLPVNARGKPAQGVLTALTGARGPWGGVFGHRNQTRNRGPGDPGDQPFEALLRAGFEGVRLDAAPPALPVTNSSKPHPAWLDASAEVDASKPKPVDQRAFVGRHLAALRAVGLDDVRATEVVAHLAIESGWGEQEHACNAGGVKATEGDAQAYERTFGGPMPWYRRGGHVASGDAPEVYYRGWPDAQAFAAGWLKRFVPREGGERYKRTGELFWSDAPRIAWFVEMIRAGYRGVVREAEIKALLAAGGDGSAHPSVQTYLRALATVRGLA